MPKSCVKISQRDRKQRYKLYELIKQRDPKRGKGQKSERGGGGVKNMAYDIDRCPMCESACRAVLLSLSSQAFFQLFRNRAYLWDAVRRTEGDREVTRLGAFRFLLAALKGFQCFFSIYEIIDKRERSHSSSSSTISNKKPFLRQLHSFIIIKANAYFSRGYPNYSPFHNPLQNSSNNVWCVCVCVEFN